MKIIVTNTTCQAIIGGGDSLVCNVYDELRRYLRVRPANYSQMLFQMRKRGNKGWDGYTYFFNAKGFFATGFLPLVLDYLKELGVGVTIDDRRENMPAFKSGNLYFESPKGALAEHQRQLIIKSNNYLSSMTKTHIWNIYFPRGIWNAATNSRKTASAGNLILNIEGARAIMLVDNQGLLEQHLEYYRTVFKDSELGYITSSKEKEGSVLIICMVRTLYNRLKNSMTVQRNMHDRFNVLIVDEVHGFSSREAVFVINKINAGVRIGMSGTPLDASDKVGRFRLIGMFGPVLHTITKRDLIDAGISLSPIIEMYLNPTLCRALTYDQEVTLMVTESEQRAELVADIICKHRKKKLLIAFFDIKHGQLMYDTFCYRYPTLASMAAIVHGTSSNRNELIAEYKANGFKYLFASTILQQGFNIPDIEGTIYAIGEKATIPNAQFRGRNERLDGINSNYLWVDIFDQGNWVGKHSKKRIALYKKEDYPIPITFHYNNRKGVPITVK